MRIWSAYADAISEPVRRQLAVDLTQAGISIAADRCPDAAGIIVLHRVTAETLAIVGDLSEHGLRKVLVIATAPIADHDLWEVLHRGASDVVLWTSATPIARITTRLERWAEIERLVQSPAVDRNLIGMSHVWRSCVRQAVEVARFGSAPVLIMGETGTGKELLARLIHTLDPRPTKGDLVLVDCTTIVPELSGSEFFGHERGAYTGAAGPRDGAFALAAGGTLFLDEVGELEPKLQAQLLRVIQEKTYKPVGGNSWREVDFRLVCATNRDLRLEVERGTFRADLYYRIASCICHTAPLSARREDIPLLARHFVAECVGAESEPPELDAAIQRHLIARDYPGNVRDLRQLLVRMMTRYAGSGPLGVADVPEDERPARDGACASWRGAQFEAAIRVACSFGAGLKEIGREAEAAAIRIVMDQEDRKLSRAAARLGVTERALQLRRTAERDEASRTSALRADDGG